MGIFDWAAPLARVIDAGLAQFANGSLRVALWALLASALSMGLYRLLSNQKGLAALKNQIAAEKTRLSDAPPEDYASALASSRQLLALSLRHVGKTLGPTLFAGLPVLFILAFLAQSYGYQAPAAGQTVAVTIAYEDGRREETALAWPLSDARLAEDVAPGFIPGAAVPVIAKPSWSDWFFANPAGTIHPESGIHQIEIAVTPQRFLPFGPDWLAGWEGLFLTLLVMASLAIKFVFRIE